MTELKPRKFFEAVPTSKEGFYQPGAFVDGYLKSEADKVIAHQKYKRCLAMANTLTWEHNYLVDFVSSDFPNVMFKRNHRLKWVNKWLKLADKFKDEK